MDTASLKTPGVYIQEIATFPPSVAEVASAVPAFIGFTELAPTPSVNRITSLVDYVALYGVAEKQKDFTASIDASGNLVVKPGKTSPYSMYYALQLYFQTGVVMPRFLRQGYSLMTRQRAMPRIPSPMPWP